MRSSLREDPHVSWIRERVEARGARCVVVDARRGEDYVAFDSHQGLYIVSDGERHNAAFSAVWWRDKPDIVIGDASADTLYSHQFRQSEVRATLQSLSAALDPSRLINDPARLPQAGNKIVQLSLASKLGFCVPETIVSQSPDEVGRFCRTVDRCIYKPLTWGMWPDGSVIFTNEMTREIVDEDPEAIAKTPGTYQAYVPKGRELRVYSIDGELLTYAIKTNSVDWRRDQFKVPFEKADLTPDLAPKIAAYMNSFGLRFGAFDFIEDPSGDLWFLECNPSGQFLWIDQANNFEIANQVVASLLEGSAKQS